jgi:damage-control phosphatase, subfamily I
LSYNKNMKAIPECRPCLSRLLRQSAQVATSDEVLRAKAIDAGMKVLDRHFSTDGLTIDVATRLHRVVRETTKNSDPYRDMKDREIKLSRKLAAQVEANYSQDFKGYLSLSLAGNAIDFFRDLEQVQKDIESPMTFTVDNSLSFGRKLQKARNLMFLADNAGEIFFDLPLVRWLRQFVAVIYVVKESPVQNDATIDDLRRAGLDGNLGKVITTGLATPGVIFESASREFRREFEAADLVLAKGMGHWEGLTELPSKGNVLHCSMAKCKPVADSMGVPLNSFVAILR